MSPAAVRSLVVILEVPDEAACAVEIARQRAALEAGWATLPSLRSACLAVLPATAREAAGLLFACEFEGELRALADGLEERAGPPLSTLFALCTPSPRAGTGSDALYRLLSAHATRAVRAPSEPPATLDLGLAWLGRARARLALSLRAPTPRGEALDEARRSAVAMQQMLPGVPLLHSTHVASPAAARRVRRVLRDWERTSASLPGEPRCWAQGERVLLLAQPREVAPLWAERVARRALGALSALWLETREFSDAPAARGPRGRYVWRFLLDQRLPIGAWYDASV